MMTNEERLSGIAAAVNAALGRSRCTDPLPTVAEIEALGREHKAWEAIRSGKVVLLRRQRSRAGVVYVAFGPEGKWTAEPAFNPVTAVLEVTKHGDAAEDSPRGHGHGSTDGRPQ